MFSTASEGERRTYTSSGQRREQQIIFGKCKRRVFSDSPVIGRLISDRELDSFNGTEALLAIINGMDSTPCEDSRTVGVVRVSNEACADGELPCPSITVSELPPDCHGRIALLDPDGEKLFVSPDITTVNRYVPMLYRGDDTLPSVIFRNGKELRLSILCNQSHKISSGILVTKLPEKGEEELYRYFSDIAESSVGKGSSVLLSASELSHSVLRALLRGAVWGELSLLLGGILTSDGLTAALSEFCRVFCELETEGREFNGYLQRGLYIDSPYLLSRAEKLCGIDTFVYDTERLAALMSGVNNNIPEELLSDLLEKIRSTVSHRPDVSHGATVGKATLSSPFCHALADCGITHFITPPELIRNLYEILKI